MKRLVLLLSVVLLTCAAPLHQNNELSDSEESQVISRVTVFRRTPRNDIIITPPEGFGKPNENGQSTVIVSLRDGNTNVSIDVLSFVFSVSSEETSNIKLGRNGGFSDEGVEDHRAGLEKTKEENNTNNDEEETEEVFDPTPGPELLNSDEEMVISEEETPDVRHDRSDEYQIHSTNSQSYSRDSSEESDQDNLKVFETTTNSDTSSLQQNSNGSDSGQEHLKNKFYTDQSDSTELSAINNLPEQPTGLRSTPVIIHEEAISAEVNGQGTHPISDTSAVEGQTVATNSGHMLGPFQAASTLSSSSEENGGTDPTLSKTPSLHSSRESMVNTEVLKKHEGPQTSFSSGSDVFPDYVNDEWQYDPRYYDPYRGHPGYDPYAAGYDPYQAGYDPYQAGYDPYQAGYDPYQAGYDPYGESYDPYRAGYDPYGPGYDPYGTRYDPYQKGYDNQDPYHESEDPRNDVQQEITPAYSVEEHENRPTEVSNNLDNSYSEEQPQPPSISPSSTPGSLPKSEEPSNSSSIETTNNPPDPAASNSEEDTERADTVGKKMPGSSSSEESAETTDSEQKSPIAQRGTQGTPDPMIQISSQVSMSHNIHEVHDEKESQSQSAVDLIPALSSEEESPLVDTIKHIVALTFNGGLNEEGTVVGTNSDSTFSNNHKKQHEESNESASDSPGISAELTHLTTESPEFNSESVPTSNSLVSNEETSSENAAPNLSANLQSTTQSTGGVDTNNDADANANSPNDSEESQESQIFTPSAVFPIARQPSPVQYTENSSDEDNIQDRKSNQGIISQFSMETPAKTIATNLWTSFLQALKVPITNHSRQSAQKNVRRSQSTRRYYQRSNRRQKANSSEERK